MSVIVKGMEMPKNCAECRMWCICDCLNDFEDYESICYAVDDGDWVMADDCPLTELPPHGRLIDADKLLEKAYWDYNEATHDYNNFKVVSEYDIADAHTVIEAEGETK